MLFSAIILSSTTVIIGCLVVLITESLYNLLYNLPSAPPEMGGLLGQSKNTINTIFVDSGKISFRKSCQYVPNDKGVVQTVGIVMDRFLQFVHADSPFISSDGSN
jgi:hypothetical protein